MVGEELCSGLKAAWLCQVMCRRWARTPSNYTPRQQCEYQPQCYAHQQWWTQGAKCGGGVMYI